MTMAPDPAPDGTQAAILIELGKLSTGQAVTNTKLDTLITSRDDHESRLRKLEAWRYGLPLTGLVSGGSLALAIVAYLHTR